jgi:hypothetical protein
MTFSPDDPLGLRDASIDSAVLWVSRVGAKSSPYQVVLAIPGRTNQQTAFSLQDDVPPLVYVLDSTAFVDFLQTGPVNNWTDAHCVAGPNIGRATDGRLTIATSSPMSYR